MIHTEALPRRRTVVRRGTVETNMPASLHVEVREVLAAAPYAELRRIGCDVLDGTATLRGSVRSFFLKQMAQHLVGQVRDIELVKNELQVI